MNIIGKYRDFNVVYYPNSGLWRGFRFNLDFNTANAIYIPFGVGSHDFKELKTKIDNYYTIKKYQYQLIQYQHDIKVDEYVSIGLVMYDPESGFLKSRFLEGVRISGIGLSFGGILHHFYNEVLKFNEEMKSKYQTLESIINYIFPAGNSILICSETFYGEDIDLEVALNRLFTEYISNPEYESYH